MRRLRRRGYVTNRIDDLSHPRRIEHSTILSATQDSAGNIVFYLVNKAHNFSGLRQYIYLSSVYSLHVKKDVNEVLNFSVRWFLVALDKR